jgi:hypothetical protein
MIMLTVGLSNIIASILELHVGGDTLSSIEDRYFRGHAELLSRTLENVGTPIPADILFPLLQASINRVVSGEDIVAETIKLWTEILKQWKEQTIDTHNKSGQSTN